MIFYVLYEIYDAKRNSLSCPWTQCDPLCSPIKTDSFSLLSNKYKLILFALQQKLIYSLYSTNKNRLILPAEHVQVTIAVHLLFMKHMLILFPVYETHVNSPSFLWNIC